MGEKGIGAPLKTSEQKHPDIEVPGRRTIKLSRGKARSLIRELTDIESSGFDDEAKRRAAAILLKRWGILSGHIYLPRKKLNIFVRDFKKVAWDVPPAHEFGCDFKLTEKGEHNGEPYRVLRPICETITYSAKLYITEDSLRVSKIRVGMDCVRSTGEIHDGSSKSDDRHAQHTPPAQKK